MQHIVFSVTKSFTGTLAGILTDLGKIDPDDSVTKYIPEGRGTAYGTARVRHLLDMSVGIHFDEDYLAPECRDIDVRQSGASTRWAGWHPHVAQCNGQPTGVLIETARID